MAFLVGLRKANGEWHNCVLAFLPYPIHAEPDILGHPVPQATGYEAYGPIGKEEGVRLARTLRGIPKQAARQLFLDRSAGLRLHQKAGRISP